MVTRAGYDDLAALRAFAAGVDVVTYEFENVALGAVDAIAPLVAGAAGAAGAGGGAGPAGGEGVPERARARDRAVLRRWTAPDDLARGAGGLRRPRRS